MDTRDRILENSLEIFLRKGCKAVTMDDIAKENGISKRTLYEHFSDKSQLLEECLDYLIIQMEEYADRLEQESISTYDNLITIHKSQSDLLINLKVNFFKELKKYYFPLYKKVFDKFFDFHLLRIRQFIRRGQQEGLILDTIDKETVPVILIEMSAVIENSEFLNSKHLSRKDLFKDIIIYYFRGISTQDGREILDDYLAKLN